MCSFLKYLSIDMLLAWCILNNTKSSVIAKNSTVYTTMQYSRWRVTPDLLLLRARLETRLLYLQDSATLHYGPLFRNSGDSGATLITT
jgi:hypothetical protein